MILYRAPYKVVVDTWAINSTYLFWGDIRETYRLFIRLRAKKEKGKFILTCHFIIKYLPVERICCCLLVWLRFGGVILTDSETAPRQDRSVVTIRRLGSFFGVKFLNFNIVWGFQKNECFLGYKNCVDIFLGHSINGLVLGVISMYFRVFS